MFYHTSPAKKAQKNKTAGRLDFRAAAFGCKMAAGNDGPRRLQSQPPAVAGVVSYEDYLPMEKIGI